MARSIERCQKMQSNHTKYIFLFKQIFGINSKNQRKFYYFQNLNKFKFDILDFFPVNWKCKLHLFKRKFHITCKWMRICHLLNWLWHFIVCSKIYLWRLASNVCMCLHAIFVCKTSQHMCVCIRVTFCAKHYCWYS